LTAAEGQQLIGNGAGTVGGCPDLFGIIPQGPAADDFHGEIWLRSETRISRPGFINLRDGRVEVYAIGTDSQFARLHVSLARGPRGAMVHNVHEEPAEFDERFANEFVITHDH